MICPLKVAIYLSEATFTELNAFSQNYLPFWPNNPFEVADFLRFLVVLVISSEKAAGMN
jgi:hypothetical protein